MDIGQKKTALGIGLFVVITVAAGLGIGFLLWELNQTNSELREASDNLGQQIEDNVTLHGLLDLSDEIIENLTSDLGESVAEAETLTSDLRESVAQTETLRTDLENTNERLEQQKLDKVILEDKLETSNEQNMGLRADLDRARIQIKNLDWDLERMAIAVKALQDESKSLRTEVERLKSVDRQAEILRTDLEEALAEIEGLKEQGTKPLILESGSTTRNGFFCTGSMEPVITCLDEATYLINFDPEDIVVGATIAFDPNCWEDTANDTGTAHRVMDIELRDDIYYFYPKGDASDEPDGCWVPHTDVLGYIIDIHKNVRPANARLRDSVQTAKAAVDVARSTYDDLVQQYCGSVVETGRCRATEAEFRLVQAAYMKYVDALDYYYCWYDVALDSRYPGHIPRECTE